MRMLRLVIGHTPENKIFIEDIRKGPEVVNGRQNKRKLSMLVWTCAKKTEGKRIEG